MRYVCTICGYVYDEEQDGTPFAELPATWICPVCTAPKELFEPEAAPEMNGAEPPAVANTAVTNVSADNTPAANAAAGAAPHTPASTGDVDPDLLEIPPGVLAAIFSNLARGCEKQYLDEEAGLFREIAVHFTKMAVAENLAENPTGNLAEDPAETPPDQAGLDTLAQLLADDLAKGYPTLSSTATDAGDRGTLRICVWGEKVTRVLASLVDRYRREGEAFLEGKRVWVCSVCGFTFVGPKPPELCPVCKVPAC